MNTTIETPTEVLAVIDNTADFARALRNAYLFTRHDQRRPAPALECVEISFLDGQLTIAATDSYGLITETINVESVAPATAVTINRDQVKQMTDALKGAKYASVTITSDQLAGCRVRVANDNAIFETTGTKVAFPDWRRLVEHCDNAPALDCTIGFAPKQVARLAKIDGGEINAPLRFDFYGTGKPARVTVGTAVAYQMPFRLS
jgi:DNA polymerase III sliding clamp (beta) subunit (PCNA family)